MLIASRVLLLPVIAGLAYELIRFGGKHPDNSIVRTALAPGLWLQRLTTREPTLDQLEVSINALKDVLAAEQRAEQERGLARVEVDGVAVWHTVVRHGTADRRDRAQRSRSSNGSSATPS